MCANYSLLRREMNEGAADRQQRLKKESSRMMRPSPAARRLRCYLRGSALFSNLFMLVFTSLLLS